MGEHAALAPIYITNERKAVEQNGWMKRSGGLRGGDALVATLS